MGRQENPETCAQRTWQGRGPGTQTRLRDVCVAPLKPGGLLALDRQQLRQGSRRPQGDRRWGWAVSGTTSPSALGEEPSFHGEQGGGSLGPPVHTHQQEHLEANSTCGMFPQTCSTAGHDRHGQAAGAAEARTLALDPEPSTKPAGRPDAQGVWGATVTRHQRATPPLLPAPPGAGHEAPATHT